MSSRKFVDINEGFTCVNCGFAIPPSAKSCRNHCPVCLVSMHLDVHPGDRAANCGGVMRPTRVEYNSKKGYQIVHRCDLCGEERRNVAALDDAIFPDSLDAVLDLMRKHE